MQSAVNHSSELINQEESEADRQFSGNVIDYQNQVETIIAWLFRKEEELQKRPDELELQDAPFSRVLEEYSLHENFISEFCEFCHTIMKCKERGQELRDSSDVLSEEDHDEIGIQMDAMLVCYEKLKILSTDRLRCLQNILEIRQKSKLERFEEWLSSIELKIARSNNIGPGYNEILRQIKDMDDLGLELEQKQDFLNFMSSVIIFDEVDSDSLQIRSKSCDSLDARLESMNHRWIDICRFVDERNDRLKKAESVWKILNSESPQLVSWLKRTEKRLQELSDASKNSADIQLDTDFLAELVSRSEKIDQEIKKKQSFYTRLENRVRMDIEKIDDPCSILVIELERKLEDLQDYWNAIMNRKRMIDYSLQAWMQHDTPERAESTMIPLPEPITTTSNSELNFDTPSNIDIKPCLDYMTQQEIRDHSNDSSQSSGNDEKHPSPQMSSSLSEAIAFDNSLNSETRSLIYGNSNVKSTLFGNSNNSQDEISSPSMTISISKNMALIAAVKDHPIYSNIEGSRAQDGVHQPIDLILENLLKTDSDEHQHHEGMHSCRVEEWRHSLESFSTWLKEVEYSLSMDTPLSNLVKPERNRHSWSRMDLRSQFLLINEIENRITASYQDEFDCILLQGQQIIEDLLPEIGENNYEDELKGILADIEIRYLAVKGCLSERRQEITNRERWLDLLRRMKESCEFIIEQTGQIISETDIGIDLITLAQQQDQLMHARADLEDNHMIHSCKQEAESFLKLCDALPSYPEKTDSILPPENLNSKLQSEVVITDQDVCSCLRDLREDIEVQLDRLSLHYSELSQVIEDRLGRLDEVHKQMHILQHKMQELAAQLQVLEILKSNWGPVEDQTVEKLSEQLEDLKLYRERLFEIESVHKTMNCIMDWMTQSETPLSHQNLKRLNELNMIWSSIQSSVEERQKLIEQAFDNQGASEQRFLEQTVSDLPGWQRKVATSRVPYFVEQFSNKTSWDHPKFEDLLQSFNCVSGVVFAAYRTALKLRMIQKKFGINLIMLEQLKEIFDQSQSINNSTNENNTRNGHQGTSLSNNDALLGVEQVIQILGTIYEKIRDGEKSSLNVPLSIDLTLNWLLNLYDSTRTGFMSSLSLKVGLALICCATREEKYAYIYRLVANQRTGNVDARKLGTLIESCMRIPVYLGEEESFGGKEVIESSLRNCFSMSKYDSQQPNCINIEDYLNWLKSEPQFILWLPVLHRLLISENTIHPIKCKLCGTNPIAGLRYRCLNCFKFNICQNCFLTGRHIFEHPNPSRHPMREYCSTTNSGENVRDLAKILRNKIKPKSAQRQS